MKMLTRGFLSLYISKFLGGACPQTPLPARTFCARKLPRLVLKSGYGPEYDYSRNKSYFPLEIVIPLSST